MLIALIKGRRATARLMKDFGTPVTKIDSPRGESIVPQFVLRPLQLRTKAATLNLPHWLDGCRDKILASLAHCYRSALRIGEFPCRLLRTKNHHFASAPFPWFSASDA